MPFPVGGEHGVPGSGDGGVDRHAGRQLVVGGALSGHAQFGCTGQRVGGQHGADGAHEAERRTVRSLGTAVGQEHVDAQNIGGR